MHARTETDRRREMGSVEMVVVVDAIVYVCDFLQVIKKEGSCTVLECS